MHLRSLSEEAAPSPLRVSSYCDSGHDTTWILFSASGKCRCCVWKLCWYRQSYQCMPYVLRSIRHTIYSCILRSICEGSNFTLWLNYYCICQEKKVNNASWPLFSDSCDSCWSRELLISIRGPVSTAVGWKWLMCPSVLPSELSALLVAFQSLELLSIKAKACHWTLVGCSKDRRAVMQNALFLQYSSYGFAC